MSWYMSSLLPNVGPSWFERRELGLRNPLGSRNCFYDHMYSSVCPAEVWDDREHHSNHYASGNIKAQANTYGGVFCLEFSPEGSVLVAAYEKKCIQLFDPLTQKIFRTIENAHQDCVNCAKFLDTRTFATCSDDFTIALWDIRNLTRRVRTLKGHTNWVKNIEYSPEDGLLVTSGFDGNVLTWEVNKYLQGGRAFTKIFGTNGLMRTCLSPDASKLIMCTTGGYIIVIHNLDLNTMAQDMDGFKPNMYRLMQLSQTVLPVASEFTPLFRGYGRRNRIEFITDFPSGDDAEVISSLQVHPDGHSIVSRNVSNGEASEWSCVHDIEERYSSDEYDSSDDEEGGFQGFEAVDWSGYSSSISTTPSYIIQHTPEQNEIDGAVIEERLANEERDLSVSPGDVWEALVAIQEARVRRERDRAPESLGRSSTRQQTSSAGRGTRQTRSGSEGRIAERGLPRNPNSAGESRENTNSSEVSQRDVSVNTDEVPNPARVTNSNNTPNEPSSIARRNMPTRLRYLSLYRRSTVGRFDRTSITRRPIYRPLIRNLRRRNPRIVRNLRNQRPVSPQPLRTNYEMNETQRIHNPNTLTIIRTGNRHFFLRQCISALRAREAGRIVPIRVQQPVFPNTVFRTFNVRFTLSGSNQNSSQIRSEIRDQIRFQIRNLNHSQSQNLNANESQIQIRIPTQDQSHILTSNESQIQIRIPTQSSLRNEQNVNGAGNSVNPNERATTSESESAGPSSGAANVTSGIASSQSQSNNGRTILMGVFRTGSEDGVRGTTMRRHNIASVTVSSMAHGSSGSAEGSDRVRGAGRRSSNASASQAVPINRLIHQNARRLTHYVKEPNVGHGFIKEISISPDGRVICSPYGNGIRLFGFSPTVQDLYYCYPRDRTVPLQEVALCTTHRNNVLSTRFSPFHGTLVSGCLSGEVIFYRPDFSF